MEGFDLGFAVTPMHERMCADLQKRVAEGGSVESWRSQAAGFLNDQAIDQVCRYFVWRTTRPQVWPPPIGNGCGQGDWYMGPNTDDRMWPEMKGRLTLPPEVIVDLDTASTGIVRLLAPPGRSAGFSCRGLVLGQVQSGKTTNFMSVAAKAADRGYRLIIVMSGVTNSLRLQTQERLEEVLVGDEPSWHWLTTRSGDFSATGNTANILLHSTGIAVIKKNPTRLRRLIRWLEQAPNVVDRTPILVIDDEADQVSIDTGTKRASTINGLIKKLLRQKRIAYVAYTATPFANLLIDPSNPEDLFPRDFVVDLPKPKDYLGSEFIFGRQPLTEEEHEDHAALAGAPILRDVPDGDAVQVRPPRKKDDQADWHPSIPDSLRDAIDWFILATTARRIRHDEVRHSSMLVHTTMLAEPQLRIRDAIQEHLSAMAADRQGTLDRLAVLWEVETGAMPLEHPIAAVDVIKGCEETLARATVVADNYKSDERLRYEPDDPATVIAVGGNTLSRGVTLEGLTSSYFLRTAKAYDTLLQMGRWFGYRPGYKDLIRVWMPEQTQAWFADLALVEAEIRAEIEQNAYSGTVKPKDLPVKIRTHPQLAVTRAAAMKSAVKAQVSFSGRKTETTWFAHKDQAVVRGNRAAVTELVEQCREHLQSFRGMGRRGFRDVPADVVVHFLRTFSIHPNNGGSGSSRNLQADPVIDYIRKERDGIKPALDLWNIVFVEPRQTRKTVDIRLESPLRLVNRSRLAEAEGPANINNLTSQNDRASDLSVYTGGRSDLEYRADRAADPSLEDRGLLLIFGIDKDSVVGHQKEGSVTKRAPLGAVDHLFGIALCFPESANPGNAVDYVVAPAATPADQQYADEEDQYQQEQAEFISQQDADDEAED